MDVSVCIPVFNSDVKKLVTALAEQIALNQLSAEIVVLDDASSIEMESQNRISLQELNHTRYFSLPKNVGRSAIRNRFIDYATGDFLLFIDGDSEIINPNFLENYTKTLSSSPIDLLYGGSVYSEDAPQANYFLRWKYSWMRESKSAQERSITPYGFKTNNFIIKKSVFSSFPFDERIQGYGHEDTLFGFILCKNKIVLNHVENPVLNSCLDTNDIFLSKTEAAIKNLWYIHKNIATEMDFVENVRLLKAYYRLKNRGLLPLLKLSNYLVGKYNKRLLLSGRFTIRMFDFFKLSMLLKQASTQDK